uniref:Uncharacterized protein n=1 Tax=Anguilla anguilla TaxID=7936 RepID=A0A0E9WUP6_ANGAN
MYPCGCLNLLTTDCSCTLGRKSHVYVDLGSHICDHHYEQYICEFWQ